MSIFKFGGENDIEDHTPALTKDGANILGEMSTEPQPLPELSMRGNRARPQRFGKKFRQGQNHRNQERREAHKKAVINTITFYKVVGIMRQKTSPGLNNDKFLMCLR